jgi:hypothetical protein
VQIGYWAANSGCVPIWKAQAALDNGSNVLLGACAYDLPLYTDGHVSYAGRNTLGTRLGTVIYKVYSGTLASGYRGPRIDSAHAITRGQFRVFVTYGAGTSCTVNGYRNFIVHQTDEQNVYPLSITGGSTIVVGIADRAMLYGLKFLYSDPHIYGYDTAQVVYDNNLLPLEPAP